MQSTDVVPSLPMMDHLILGDSMDVRFARLVEAAVEILGNPSLSYEDVEAQVAAVASEPMLVRRLVDVVPEAFGLVLISHIKYADQMEFPSTFSVKDGSGHWQSISFQKEPIFLAALQAAQAMFHSGPRLTFQTVTDRSAMLATVNNALNNAGNSDGSPLIGCRLEGPSFFGIPADIYDR